MSLTQITSWVGLKSLNACGRLGSFTLFLLTTVKTLFSKRLKLQKILEQVSQIGVASLPIVVLTGSFTGIVFAMQSYIGFSRVGGENFIGAVVALAMIRELGPVLTALMVTGRAGSAIAAEIGTMKITEQIDALKTLQINPFQYLIVPRIVTSIMVLPLLTLFSMVCGIVGGYLLCVYVLALNPQDYINSIRQYVEMSDVAGGLVKSSFFGLIFSWVGCYKGYYTAGGARGVGKSTTQAVVLASVLILIANTILTACMEAL